MIKQISHATVAGIDPAKLDLALAVIGELHAPTATRAPEIAPQLMGLRTPATRTHRRRVRLHRLDALRG
ncbi:hypothetical protein [Streptomyces sp. 142MFCol3.1]|uniref:hypothetical protein n=1 Tax=Streptomyces sp. 142MFCol3.1 TaxID=1172179 RepID=UPI000427A968|nr:hypothetical protein [Streptomyces sp. 142MFCol3.1]